MIIKLLAHLLIELLLPGWTYQRAISTPRFLKTRRESWLPKPVPRELKVLCYTLEQSLIDGMQTGTPKKARRGPFRLKIALTTFSYIECRLRSHAGGKKWTQEPCTAEPS